jgi:uncharacterized protein (TIGR02266 family)
MKQLPLFKFDSQPSDENDEVCTTEKRQYPRAVVACPVIVERDLGLFMNGKIRDISPGGAFITCREPLQPDEAFQIEFNDAHLEQLMKATAEVIWSNVSVSDENVESRGMGVRFTEISHEAKTVISSLVSNSPNAAHQEETFKK